MPSYPSNQNPWDQTPDWATGDFQGFERAVDGGVPLGPRNAAWDGGGELIKAAGPKEPSKLDNFKRSLNENGFTLGEIARLGARATVYGLQHPDDRRIAYGEFNAKNGVINREQDRVNREFLQKIQHVPEGQKALQKYNEFISNGKIKVVP